MSDAALFVWGADEHGSYVDDDLVDAGPNAPPPPPPVPGPLPKSVDECVRELWIKYMHYHKIKNHDTDPDSTHFALWGDVDDVRDLRPLLKMRIYAVGTARVGRGLSKTFEVAKSDKKNL